MTTQQGSAGNVLAALASFLLPGLGQLVQGRLLAALFYFVLSGFIWFITLSVLGVVGHLIAAADAALWKGR